MFKTIKENMFKKVEEAMRTMLHQLKISIRIKKLV